MTTEPKRRRNGKCARPGCDKALITPSVRQRGVDPKVYDREPFCSSTCCRIYYGLIDTVGSTS